MQIGAALSTHPAAASAGEEAVAAASARLRGAPVDLALVFASPDHAEGAEALLQAVHRAAAPGALLGCVAEGIVAGRREVESGPAVVVWAASLPAPVETFHLEFLPTESGGEFAGWRAGEGARGHEVLLLLSDPFTFPADLFLEQVNEHLPGVIVAGGLASGAREPGRTVLFLDREVHREGAVGARLPSAVAVRSLVSQGCRPIGDAYVVTKADRNIVLELGGRPPLERLRDMLQALAVPDRQLVARGLHMGRVIDEYKAEHGVGDFLVRGVIGADPESGAIAVGDRVEVGETVRFHVRDAATADEDLRSTLERSTRDLPGSPAGALVFTCNGRGTRLFPEPDHDAEVVSSYLRDPPVAGFFCAGELGPVGGRNFLHGFTASVVVFVGGGEQPATSPPPTP